MHVAGDWHAAVVGGSREANRKVCRFHQRTYRWHLSGNRNFARHLAFRSHDFNLRLAWHRSLKSRPVFILDGGSIDFWKDGKRPTRRRTMEFRRRTSSADRWVYRRFLHRIAGLHVDDFTGQGREPEVVFLVLLRCRIDRYRSRHL